MNIMICVGSSCHLKKSRRLVEKFKQLIDDNHLEEKISLKGSFCMGLCSNEGIGVKIDEDFFNVKIEDAESFFAENILRGE